MIFQPKTNNCESRIIATRLDRRPPRVSNEPRKIHYALSFFVWVLARRSIHVAEPFLNLRLGFGIEVADVKHPANLDHFVVPVVVDHALNVPWPPKDNATALCVIVR